MPIIHTFTGEVGFDATTRENVSLLVAEYRDYVDGIESARKAGKDIQHVIPTYVTDKANAVVTALKDFGEALDKMANATYDEDTKKWSDHEDEAKPHYRDDFEKLYDDHKYGQ